MQERIYQLIRLVHPSDDPIGAETHLFDDFGFDSLSFVSLISAIEDEFDVRFRITEYESCLVVGNLLRLVAERTC